MGVLTSFSEFMDEHEHRVRYRDKQISVKRPEMPARNACSLSSGHSQVRSAPNLCARYLSVLHRCYLYGLGIRAFFLNGR